MAYINHNPQEFTRHLLSLVIAASKQQTDATIEGVTLRDLAKWLADPSQGPLEVRGG